MKRYYIRGYNFRVRKFASTPTGAICLVFDYPKRTGKFVECPNGHLYRIFGPGFGLCLRCRFVSWPMREPQ